MNAFMVENGILYTPSLDDKTILQGLTRELTLQVAKALKIPAKTQHINICELITADEVFGTGTAANITPIAGFKSSNWDAVFYIDNGEVGPITKELSRIVEHLQVNELPEEYKDNENLIKLQKEITTIIPL